VRRAVKLIVFSVVSLLAASAVMIGVLALLTPVSPDAKPAIATVTSAGPTIERVRELSALTTLRVDVADAFVTELRGRTGGTTVVLVVRGEVVIGVDLAGARFESVDGQGRSAVLALPQPQVQFARLDHERTKLVGVWPGGLWTIVPGGADADAAAVNAAYREAQRAVVGAADDPELAGRARRQAEAVLRTFFGALGWDVRVRWKDGTRTAGRHVTTPAAPDHWVGGPRGHCLRLPIGGKHCYHSFRSSSTVFISHIMSLLSARIDHPLPNRQ
jgi:hypothetical protein